MNNRQIDIAGVESLAQSLAAIVDCGDAILLHGDLGAGKTTFAKAFIQAYCGVDHAGSPTFNLAQHYPVPGKVDVWHYDLYRLEDSAEVEETGLPETLDQAITLIEWPEIAAPWLSESCLHITFAFHDNPQYRVVSINGDHRWMQRLKPLVQL